MPERRILVTGGGSGIGFSIAQHLARQKHKVIISGRSAKRLQSAAACIPEATMLELDVTCNASVKRAFETLSQQGNLPDILINNAGAAVTAPFEKTSPDNWHHMLAVNLTGAFLCTRQALPHMKERRFGRIITVASTAGLKGYAYTAAYTAAKHGVIGMTRSLALELAGSGVTANTVCPGFTDTDIVKTAISNIMEKTGRTEEEARRELTKHNPAGRLISPTEVATTVAWLCSDAAGAINGQAIAIDCGETIS